MKKIVWIIIALVIIGGAIYYFANKGKNVDQKQVVKVGVLLPLTGENATYGEATKKGLELALEEIEKLDEYKHFKIDLIFEDSKLEAPKAVTGIQKLISVDKVPVIIGPFGSSEVMAVSPIANQNKVPIISASATADAIKTAGDYVFRIVPSNNEQGFSMADFVIKTLNIRDSIAIIALNNEYGISLSNAFKSKINELGGKIIFEDKFDEKTSDFRTLILKIKEKSPNFIYLPDHYNEAGTFLKQAREMGINCIIGGGDGSYSPNLITVANKGAERFYLTLMGMDNSNQKTKVFEENFLKRYNSQVDVYSAYAYDALFVIAVLLKNLSINELVKIDGEKVQRLLMNVKFNGITGSNYFDVNGEVNKSFNIYQVQNSAFKLIVR